MKYLIIIIGLVLVLVGFFGFAPNYNYSIELLEDLDRVKYLREQSGTFNEEEWEASREELLEEINNINNTASTVLYSGIVVTIGGIIIPLKKKK